MIIDDILKLTEFSLSSVAYFSYSGDIYRQLFGMAMGSSLTPLGCKLFMGWLQQKAFFTSPITCCPRLWKRYVDNVLEVIRKGEVDVLTDHLNQTDPSNNIKFTMSKRKTAPFPSWTLKNLE